MSNFSPVPFSAVDGARRVVVFLVGDTRVQEERSWMMLTDEQLLECSAGVEMTISRQGLQNQGFKLLSSLLSG